MGKKNAFSPRLRSSFQNREEYTSGGSRACRRVFHTNDAQENRHWKRADAIAHVQGSRPSRGLRKSTPLVPSILVNLKNEPEPERKGPQSTQGWLGLPIKRFMSQDSPYTLCVHEDMPRLEGEETTKSQRALLVTRVLSPLLSMKPDEA